MEGNTEFKVGVARNGCVDFLTRYVIFDWNGVA